MDISGFMGGNFFSQLDLSSPAQVMTIGKVDQQVVGQGAQAETKVCTTFNESAKPLVLNKTNLTRIAAMYSTDSSQWPGRQLLVYRSSTTFGGQPKLCVRVCGPQQSPPDPICDPQGNVVPYSQAIAQQQQTVQPPVAAQPAATQPAPVVAPQPVASPQQPAQQQQSAPWEQPAQQNNPPSA
jgi:hypothetical protein